VSYLVDEKYYQVVPSNSVAERLLVAARDRIYRDFMARMRPSPAERILDVGVSNVINDGANVLERSYPHQEAITACGLGDGHTFKMAYPAVNYVRIEPNERLPFDDDSFAVATSNAVLEHVGSFERQVEFVRELCRVAERVFISVPNRFFPVEHHTALPIAHYGNATFRIACRATGKSDWAEERNLILMTRKRLWRLAASVERNTAVGYTGLLLGPFSSNLYLALH
jgi:SAM-dependent methyltransferase